MRRASRARGLGIFLALLALGADERLFDEESRVDVLVNPHVDFSRLETYRWDRDQKIVAELEHHLRVVVAVQRRMSALGYEIDINDPDLRLTYQYEIGETEVTPRPKACLESEYDADDYPWGTLIIALIAAAVRGEHTVEHVELTVMLFDVETNWLAFRARGTFPWSEDESEWILDQAVRELLEQFPRQG